MSEVWNVDWYSRNSQRLYPIYSAATGKSSDGVIDFPNDLIVDMSITATFNYQPHLFSIEYLDIYQNGVIIALSYNSTMITAINISYSETLPYTYTFNTDNGIVGFLVAYSTREAQNTPSGRWQFDINGGRIEPGCITIMPQGVSSIRVQTSSGMSDALTGDIVFALGSNVVYSGSGSTFEIDICDTTGFTTCTNCPPGMSPITSINGIGPDSNGNLNINATTCIQPVADSSGLSFLDNCSEPLCGSAEFDTLTEAVRVLEREYNAINKLATALQQQMGLFKDVMVASKLSDIACRNTTTT